MTDVVIPALGESINSGVIATWRKRDGDTVERDETLLELETDKITLELPSPAAGVLKHKAAEGDTVDVGAVVAMIDESGAAATANGAAAPAKAPPASGKAAPEKPSPAPASAPAPAPTIAPSPAKDQPRADPAPAKQPAPAAPAEHADDSVRATPLAKKIAEEQGVRLDQVKGTGAGGRIREQDVLAFVQTHDRSGAAASAPAAQPTAGPAPAPAGSRATSRERMTPLRQRIAARLVEAQHTAAILTTFNECDMTSVMRLRSKHKEAFSEAHGVGLGFMSFFVKAAASALRAYPLVNASIVEGPSGPEIEKRDYCDIAIAVGTPKGLTVPVLRGCESLSFAGVESGIRDLAAKARDGKLALADLQGGTFTISNGGIYGSMMSTPILNPPQAAILGMHNIVRRPVENPDKPGSGEVVVRPMMYLALSYDHRLIDGAEAVSFLIHIRRAIEDPERLLLDL